MNHLLLGFADKTHELLQFEDKKFLLIADGPTAEAFLTLPNTRLFDITKHRFNPLKGMDYRRAREFASVVYGDKDLMTYRDGKRALTRMLLDATRLDKLPEINHKGYQDARDTVDDLLLSPVLRQVLCNPTNFSFKGRVVLKLDRTQIADQDAFILASLFVQAFKGQVIVLDGGFYGRDFYLSLITENRLTIGLQLLNQLSRKAPELREAVLLIKDKIGTQCLWDDALELAKYAGLIPGTVAHTTFIQETVA